MTDTQRITELVLRRLDLKEQAAAIQAELDAIDAELTAGRESGDTLELDGRPVLTVVRQRRFSTKLAAEHCTDAQLAAITVPKIDPARARDVLPPQLYERCRQAGTPYLKAVEQ